MNILQMLRSTRAVQSTLRLLYAAAHWCLASSFRTAQVALSAAWRLMVALPAGSQMLWETGLLQSAFRHLLVSLGWLLRWYFANASRTIPGTLGGLFAFWLATLFASVPTTKTLMSYAFGPLGMVIFYVVIVGAGALLAAGVLEFRRPYDDR